MTTRDEDMLCKALEMAEGNTRFYSDAIRSCTGGPGKAVFTRLYEDEKNHEQRIRTIYESVSSGTAWSDACQLPEDASKSKRKLPGQWEKQEQQAACETELGAISTGLELERNTVDFYEQWKKQAQDETEKRFVERMIQEERANFILLSDLQYFYEDPEGWSLKEDDQILDGA